jgi:hypothetical protein
MAIAAVIVQAAAGATAAAEPPEIDDEHELVYEDEHVDEPEHDERTHRLVLDPAPLFRHEGLASQRDGDHGAIDLGVARLRFGSDWWSNADDERLPPIDLPARGWKATLQLSHDFAWFDLVVGAGFGQVDVGGLAGEDGDRTGRGRYLDLGVALVHSARLSRWVTWWISLGVNYGMWVDGRNGALGPASGYTLGLTIGTTFK